ncbi:flagellar hook-basal body complex protein FliE [Aeromonas australiensis]|uniref:flagellar hook-basal body complex protein FliE n=1 Tax=Aeromonas australiensis TaxID=1114880 RepID=UPI00058A4A32|nr:flagellar hook-basal body complex protein FliE [Aeromonas australiensis]MCF3096886.1 flagellar hook-basal body complex protein FliE [Aeromonas australiensis]
MEISASSLMQEMQALKIEAGTTSLTPPARSVTSDFGQLLQQALGNVNELQGAANDLRTRFDMGDKSVDLAEVMIAGQKSSIAFEATVQVRNKMVDAYKTIMNMPV